MRGAEGQVQVTGGMDAAHVGLPVTSGTPTQSIEGHEEKRVHL